MTNYNLPENLFLIYNFYIYFFNVIKPLYFTYPLNQPSWLITIIFRHWLKHYLKTRVVLFEILAMQSGLFIFAAAELKCIRDNISLISFGKYYTRGVCTSRIWGPGFGLKCLCSHGWSFGFLVISENGHGWLWNGAFKCSSHDGWWFGLPCHLRE